MEFSVVEVGHDQDQDRDQIDRCLRELGERLARLAVRTDAAVNVAPELAQARVELARLGGLLRAAYRADAPDATAGDGRLARQARQVLLTAEQEAAEIRARARADLAAAREEASQLRDRVYAEAVQARREFEATLHARRLRAERADEILRGVTVTPMSRPGPDADRSGSVEVASVVESRR